MSRLNSFRSYVEPDDNLEDLTIEFIKIGNKVIWDADKIPINQKYLRLLKGAESDNPKYIVQSIYKGYLWSMFVLKNKNTYAKSKDLTKNTVFEKAILFLNRFIQNIQLRFGKITFESELTKHWRGAHKWLGQLYIEFYRSDKSEKWKKLAIENLDEAILNESYGAAIFRLNFDPNREEAIQLCEKVLKWKSFNFYSKDRKDFIRHKLSSNNKSIQINYYHSIQIDVNLIQNGKRKLYIKLSTLPPKKRKIVNN